MTLDILKDKEKALIIDIDASQELKSRLFSFGLVKGEEVRKISSSLRKATLIIELKNSCVILRANEARAVKIQRLVDEKN